MRRLCDLAIALACSVGLVMLSYFYKEMTK